LQSEQIKKSLGFSQKKVSQEMQQNHANAVMKNFIVIDIKTEFTFDKEIT
jgi:hypothetical protein